MKVRNGFVSNSSSSSFILGVARILDLHKLDKFLTDNDIKDEFSIIALAEIKKNIYYNDEITFDENVKRLSIYNFSTNATINLDNDSPTEMVFITNISNDEGDSRFLNEYDDIDYDIDLSYFNNDHQKLYKMFSDPNSGLDIDKSNVTYGAARNG